MRGDEPACRTCQEWKRSGPSHGVCWHPEHHNRRVYEDDSCPRYVCRVIVVRREVPDATVKQ